MCDLPLTANAPAGLPAVQQLPGVVGMPTMQGATMQGTGY